MRETITVLELISRIRKTREKMDELYNFYINPATRSESRAMVSLCNNGSSYSINGRSVNDVKDEIIWIDNEIRNTFKKLQKLLIIKEQINSTCTLKVKSPFDGSDTEYTIAQILVLKSSNISKYITEYLDKLEEDYNLGKKALSDHQKSVLSEDKIDRYVIAKMNSLNINPDSKNENTYYNFANEYKLANRFEILDPLDIASTIKQRKEYMSDFYESINIKLMEFNAKTKIWLDLSLDDNFWGILLSIEDLRY